MKRTMLFISIFMCLFGIVSATAQNPVLSPLIMGDTCDLA